MQLASEPDKNRHMGCGRIFYQLGPMRSAILVAPSNNGRHPISPCKTADAPTDTHRPISGGKVSCRGSGGCKIPCCKVRRFRSVLASCWKNRFLQSKMEAARGARGNLVPHHFPHSCSVHVLFRRFHLRMRGSRQKLPGRPFSIVGDHLRALVRDCLDLCIGAPRLGQPDDRQLP